MLRFLLYYFIYFLKFKKKFLKNKSILKRKINGKSRKKFKIVKEISEKIFLY